ncbi:SLC16A13 [Branchiostoma lanceolatum]|uniref:SLC16A13 protein n=1 Tax=Branchiostoma lanceolatum TaxID=7740 RepID=A0A8K0EH40_BRALA|nr:SLC16A13 [Branchiostoma lanceolatum]
MPRHRLLKNGRKAVDPPDGGWGWVVALSGSAMLASTFGIIHSMGVFFVPWREQFVGASAAEVALVPSMVMGITNLAAPIASGLGRKFGLRPVIMSGGVLAAAGFCLSRLATHISHLYITIGCLVGIVGIVGRCISGVAPEWERYRRIDQYGTVAVLMGFAMMLVPLATSNGSMVAYSVVFGLLFGALIPITITTAADLVEMEKLPSAMGLRMFVQGVATLVGPAVSGKDLITFVPYVTSQGAMMQHFCWAEHAFCSED